VDDPYAPCKDTVERSASSWNRLTRCGINVDVGAMGQDIAQFERHVLEGTALFMLLDSLTVH